MNNLEKLNQIEKEFDKYFKIQVEANKKIFELDLEKLKRELTKKEMYDYAIAVMSRANAEFEIGNLQREIFEIKKAIEA